MVRIETRTVIHFPGFEPVSAESHLKRFVRTAQASATIWGYGVSQAERTADAPLFVATGKNWSTQTRFHVLDHADDILALLSRPLWRQILSGYCAGFKVALSGGLVGYFRTAWRFGLFFLFPFMLMTVLLIACAGIGLAPVLAGLPVWHLAWSLPLGLFAFRHAGLPFAAGFHTLLLFADWQFAWAMATLSDGPANARLADLGARLEAALAEPADEIVISSHSMGAIVATHVLGALLERNPEALAGKKVVFLTLGGAVLQSALLSPARKLRERVAVLCSNASIFWIDVQSLTDVAHFYKAHVTHAIGRGDLRGPVPLRIRMKTMLSAETYRRIKRDLLRVHRQYVFAPEQRARFDFGLLALGPIPAQYWLDFAAANDVPIDAEGTIQLVAGSAGALRL